MALVCSSRVGWKISLLYTPLRAWKARAPRQVWSPRWQAGEGQKVRKLYLKSAVPHRRFWLANPWFSVRASVWLQLFASWSWVSTGLCQLLLGCPKRRWQGACWPLPGKSQCCPFDEETHVCCYSTFMTCQWFSFTAVLTGCGVSWVTAGCPVTASSSSAPQRQQPGFPHTAPASSLTVLVCWPRSTPIASSNKLCTCIAQTPAKQFFDHSVGLWLLLQYKQYCINKHRKK